MLLVLPIFTFFLLLQIFRRIYTDWRAATLAAAVCWGSYLVLMTELLSVPRWLTRGAVAACWFTAAVACFIYLKINHRSAAQGAATARMKTTEATTVLDGTTKALLYGTGIIGALVAITALIAPPSGEDGMVYHLPRLIMWMNNRNVGFFPTPNYTQLIYGGWAEYAMMHSYLLWGTDRFVNMVEFFSFAGSVICVSYIAKLLGLSPRGQALAALACATIPEGILEASGPMNTYVVSFWIATTVALLLTWNENPSWLNTVLIGLAAGLAIFTKGLAYIFLPFLVAAVWWMGRRSTRVVFLQRSVLFLLLIFAINGPQYLRDYRFTGSPLGTSLNYGETQVTIKHVTVTGTLANILRNISLQTGAPVESLNSRIENGYRAAIHAMGSDPDDPEVNIWGERFAQNHFSFSEILAGNPLHLLLLALAMGIIFVRLKDSAIAWSRWYSLGILGGFVFMCAILRWQRWSSRFHLPLFVLGAVLIALLLERYFSRRMATAICAVLLALGLLYASMNRFRSLIPAGRWLSAYGQRSMLYFAYENEYMAPSYIAAAEFVNQLDCRNVGIDAYTPLSDPEIKRSPDSFFVYPIIAIIHANGRERTTWYSGVHNLTARYESRQPHPAPCAVVCLSCAKYPEKLQEYSGLGQAKFFNDVVVFTAPGAKQNPNAPAPR